MAAGELCRARGVCARPWWILFSWQELDRAPGTAGLLESILRHSGLVPGLLPLGDWL